jgi:hypothetical protein
MVLEQTEKYLLRTGGDALNLGSRGGGRSAIVGRSCFRPRDGSGDVFFIYRTGDI